MAHVTKGKTSTGEARYVLRYRDPDGKQREEWFSKEGDAKRRKSTVEADLIRGCWIDPRRASITFREWSDEWLASDPTKRPKTVACDENTLKVHLWPALGTKRLGAITQTEVKGLVAKWSQTAKPSTVKRRYAVLRAIFAAAVESDVIGRTPCRAIKLPTVERGEHHIVTAVELRKLSEAVGTQHEALLHVGALLGLRFSECAGLRVRNLDLLRRTLSVEETVSEVRGKIVVGPPKSAAGRRSMLMPPELVRMLSVHLQAHGLTASDPEAYVFGAPNGGPLRYAAFRSRVWVPACKKAGLEGLGFHDLRRTAATVLVASGIDVRTAQARLGHSDPRVTLGLYAQVTNDGDQRAADQLGEHFFSIESDRSESASRG